MEGRRYTQAISAYSVDSLAADVREGLSRPGQKELHSKYFYDEIGSALFEVISLLPEYGLTRADERLLRTHAHEIVQKISFPIIVAELGSGSGKKTRSVLEVLAQAQPTKYYPIEISPSALTRCEQELGSIPSVRVIGIGKPYLDGLIEVTQHRGSGEHLLVLFLGSTIGNFDRDAGEQFLSDVRGILRPGDGLLLGTDLEKEIARMILAYDDPLGVTAAFNLNILSRINRELMGDFELSQYRHMAVYNKGARRIEMHLRSTVDQTVTIPQAGLTVSLRKNETIWTENSHKYHADEIQQMAGRTGFQCTAQWIDREWPFAESLLMARD